MPAPDPLEAFFAAYAARFNAALADPPVEDVEATAGAFAACFVGAGPAGVRCAHNDAAFREQLPEGYAFSRRVGTKGKTILGLEQTPLDGLHTVVTVHWRADYARPTGEAVGIEFDVFYLVQTRDEGPKIFAYVTGDEQQALRDHGLLQDGADGGPVGGAVGAARASRRRAAGTRRRRRGASPRPLPRGSAAGRSCPP